MNDELIAKLEISFLVGFSTWLAWLLTGHKHVDFSVVDEPELHI